MDSAPVLRYNNQLLTTCVGKIVKMHEDKKLKGLVNSCDLVFTDGQPIVIISKWFGEPLKERVSGIDLMHEIVKHSQEKKYRLYFLGAREEIVRKTVAIYKNKFPGLYVSGWHNGYFNSRADEKNVIEEIKNLKPDVLFVAMGSPKKEYWIRENLEYLQVPVCLGVGGSFDVIAGYVKRAPMWMQTCALEWFFRFLCEPRRMWKRYLFTNTAFIWMVLKQGLDRLRLCYSEK